MARWTLRAVSGAKSTPAEALVKLNREMLTHTWDTRFITIAHVALTILPDGTGVQATIACAGHPAPLIVPDQGVARELEVGGDIVGVWEEPRLQTTEVRLGRGNALVVFRDGVTDQGPTGPRRSPAQAL